MRDVLAKYRHSSSEYWTVLHEHWYVLVPKLTSFCFGPSPTSVCFMTKVLIVALLSLMSHISSCFVMIWTSSQLCLERKVQKSSLPIGMVVLWLTETVLASKFLALNTDIYYSLVLALFGIKKKTLWECLSSTNLLGFVCSWSIWRLLIDTSILPRFHSILARKQANFEIFTFHLVDVLV